MFRYCATSGNVKHASQVNSQPQDSAIRGLGSKDSQCMQEILKNA